MAAFDVTKFTMGEIATIESLSGQSISIAENDTTPKGLFLAACALIQKRRTGEPAFTWNAAQGLTLTEINEILGVSTAADDDEATAPKASTPKPSPKTD